MRFAWIIADGENDSVDVAETASKMAVAAVLASTAEGFAPTLRAPGIPSLSKASPVLLCFRSSRVCACAFESVCMREREYARARVAVTAWTCVPYLCACVLKRDIPQAAPSRVVPCRCACRRPACAQSLRRRWATSRTSPSRKRTSARHAETETAREGERESKREIERVRVRVRVGEREREREQ